jgi:hypothetical protein
VPWSWGQGAYSSSSSRRDRLEFGLIPALGYDKEPAAKTLYAEILSDPASFIELLKLVYHPSTRTDREEPSESSKAAAEIAHRVLMRCKRVPGMREDGTVDEAAFSDFVEEARKLAAEAGRAKVFDSELGEMLAHAPAGADGIWPFQAARDLLDRPELETARKGLATGLFNKRGMVSKSFAEGGGQERELAALYHGQAQALHQSHPLLAAALDRLGRDYEAYARGEDIEAKLRQEG